jgi:hypothetical protein
MNFVLYLYCIACQHTSILLWPRHTFMSWSDRTLGVQSELLRNALVVVPCAKSTFWGPLGGVVHVRLCPTGLPGQGDCCFCRARWRCWWQLMGVTTLVWSQQLGAAVLARSGWKWQFTTGPIYLFVVPCSQKSIPNRTCSC